MTTAIKVLFQMNRRADSFPTPRNFQYEEKSGLTKTWGGMLKMAVSFFTEVSMIHTIGNRLNARRTIIAPRAAGKEGIPGPICSSPRAIA